jgi:hypothetical protein
MAVLKKQPEYKQTKKKMSNKTKITAIACAVVVVLILYYAVFLNVSQTVVGTPAVANLTKSGTIFSVNSQQYLISLTSISGSTGKAYIHISRLPIFASPLLNVTLTLNNITKINAGTAYANMGIELQSIGQNSITVRVSPLFISLQIAPDSQYIKVVQGTLYNSGQLPVTTSIGSSTVITTTAVSSSTVATTSTVVDTTAAQINATLRQDNLYSLLLNFSKLYANTSRCTSSLYNSTYASAHMSVPSGPNTYENVSIIVPYNMSVVINNVGGGGNYNANFVTKASDPFYNNKVAATIQVNPTQKLVVSDAINSTGIFAGQTYTQIGSAYLTAASRGVCGVMV